MQNKGETWAMVGELATKHSYKRHGGSPHVNEAADHCIVNPHGDKISDSDVKEAYRKVQEIYVQWNIGSDGDEEADLRFSDTSVLT